jgi:hypothetical protein
MSIVYSLFIIFTLKFEAIRTSETSVLTHIPEDGVIHSHRRENILHNINLLGFVAEKYVPCEV